MQENIKFLILILVGTGISILLVGIIILSLFHYQRSKLKHLEEIVNLKNIYQQEILKVQLEVKEQTLHFISQEIHDNIGQILSLAKLNLNTLPCDEGDRGFDKIYITKELISKAIQDLRNLSKTLNSEYLSHHNLSQSVKFELEAIEKTGFCTTKYEVLGKDVTIDPQKQLIIFRIIQEALNNIIKHAKAKCITLILNYSPLILELRIEDDGIGFDTTVYKDLKNKGIGNGTGIWNIINRANIIGAEFNIEGREGNGTIIKLLLPI